MHSGPPSLTHWCLMDKSHAIHHADASRDVSQPPMKISEKISLALSIIAIVLSVTTFVQSIVAAHRKEQLAIRNGYSLGQAIAGYISVVAAGDSDDPQTSARVRNTLAQIVYLANSYGQNLQIDPKGMVAFLTELKNDRISDLRSTNLLT